MVPTVASSEAIRPSMFQDLMPFIKDGSSKYEEIINSRSEDWLANMDHLKSIFHWGLALGKLIHLVDESPKEAERTLRETRFVHDQLTQCYDQKKALLNCENIKKDFVSIVEESDNVMKQLLYLHLHLDPDVALDLHTLFSKYEIHIDIKRVPDMFPVSEFKKASVVATAVFYVYQMVALNVFHTGLQEGMAKSDSQTTDQVLNEELLRLYVDLDSTFKKLEEQVN